MRGRRDRTPPTLGTPEPEVDPLAVALAEHLGVEVESITGYVIGVEHVSPEDKHFSSVWSLTYPSWGAIGAARELLRQITERYFGTVPE